MTLAVEVFGTSDLFLEARYFVPEVVPLFLADGLTPFPGCGRRRTVSPRRSAQFVVPELGALDVVAGWCLRAAILGGEDVGPGLEGSCSRLDGAIVLGGGRRAEKRNDLVGEEELLSVLVDEAASVVALEDERGPHGGEEHPEGSDDGEGGLVAERQGQEFHAAGEVADEEEIREDPIDRDGDSVWSCPP